MHNLYNLYHENNNNYQSFHHYETITELKTKTGNKNGQKLKQKNQLKIMEKLQLKLNNVRKLIRN